MPRPKKNTTTFKRGRGRPKGSGKGHTIKGLDETFKPEYEGQDPKVDKIPAAAPDTEAAPPPVDEASKHKYPPPRNHPRFRQVWMDFIDSITSRENFKVGHLNSLEILCDLYVDYDEYRKFLRTHGRTYQSYGRQGMIWKTFPEVNELTRVQSQIKEYLKMLNLVPKKDHSPESGGEKDEWS